MTSFKRLLSIMTKPEIMFIFLLVNIGLFFYVDRVLATYFFNLTSQINVNFLNWFTDVGLGFIYIIGFGLAALFFRYGSVNRCWEERCWFLWLGVVLTGSVCVVIKVILGRARPIMWFENHLYGFYGFQTHSTFWSLPSGHTTTLMAIVFALSVLFPRYCYTFIVTGFLIAFTRVLLTQHYLTDILIGSYLALLEIGAMWWILQKQGWLKHAWAASLEDLSKPVTSTKKVLS